MRLGERGTDRGRQTEPDRLEGLGEAEAVLVGHRHEHARVAHEVARVDAQHPLRRQQVVERDAQRPGIDAAGSAGVVERHVAPADGLARGAGGGPAPCGSRLGSRPGPAATRGQSHRHRRRPRGGPAGGAPSAARSSSTWTTVASAAISRPCRVVHMFRAQPHPTTRSASAISSAASGDAKPPDTSSDQSLPLNSPRATAEVASSAPYRSASASSASRQPGPRDPRPAMNTGRSALAKRLRQAVERLVVRRPLWRGRTRQPGGPQHARLGLQVQRQVEQDGTTAVQRRRDRSAGLLHGRLRRRDPHRHGADRLGQCRLVDVEVRAWLGDLGREHDHRAAALGGLGDPGHRVGEPAALVDGDRRDPPAHPGEAVRHRRRAALVPRGHEPGPGRHHRVRHVEVARPDHAEDVVDADCDQGAADGLGDVHRLTARRGPAPWPASRTRRRCAAARRRRRRRWAAARPRFCSWVRPYLLLPIRYDVAGERRREHVRHPGIRADRLDAEADDG